MNTQLLYGDIGGTKTILQLAEIADGQIHERRTQRYDSAAFATFSDILRDFLGQATTQPPPAACFAVAGPIADQQATLTNLPWQISSANIAQEFSIAAVKLINDFEAVALAIENLPSSDLTTLQSGNPHAHAMRVVLGAGTGMGVAWLTPVNNRYFAWPTEAGHIDFAPLTPLQIGLLEWLQQRFGHVSVERLLSGSGLTNIFKFLQTQVATKPITHPTRLILTAWIQRKQNPARAERLPQRSQGLRQRGRGHMKQRPAGKDPIVGGHRQERSAKVLVQHRTTTVQLRHVHKCSTAIQPHRTMTACAELREVAPWPTADI